MTEIVHESADRPLLPRVIYAWNYLEWGGAQVHILAIIKEAREHFDILVALPEASDPKIIRYLENLGIDHILFPGSNDMGPARTLSRKIARRYRKMQSEWSMLRCLSRQNLGNAIFHIDLLPHSSLAALWWLARRTHVFITSHNALSTVSPLREELWKLRCRIMSRSPKFHVFCSNEHAKAYYSRHYSPEFSEKIEVTYTSMNPDEIDRALEAEFGRDGWREKLGIPRDAFVVITVGNFIDRKGRWTLLEAAALLNKEPAASDIYFVWLSPFLPEGEDAFRVEGYGLGGRFQVVLSDSVGTKRLDVLKFFRIADVFALPSFVEGLPISLLEAMALGLPCISTNVFAIPEALKHEETGLLIEAGDSAGLAESILKYKNEPDFRAEMAESGRDYVLSHFDEREVARRVVSAYKRALDLET